MCRITENQAKACEFNVGGVNKLWLANLDDITAWADSNSDGILDEVTFFTAAITDITNANPAVVTTGTNHNRNTGDVIQITGTTPMSGILGTHTITVLSDTTFELDGVDTTGEPLFGASSLVMRYGSFLAFEFFKGQASANSNLQVSDSGNRFFQHAITVNIVGQSQALIEEMELLALSRMVAVTKSNTGNYHIWGRVNGLEAIQDGANMTLGQAEGDFAGMVISLQSNEVEHPPVWDETVNGLPVIS